MPDTMLGSGNKTVGKTNKSSCPHGDDVPAGRERNKLKKKRIFNPSDGDRFNKEKKIKQNKETKCHW